MNFLQWNRSTNNIIPEVVLEFVDNKKLILIFQWKLVMKE